MIRDLLSKEPCFHFDRRATDIIWRYLEDGSRVRVSKHTGRIIPIPINEEQKTEGDEIAINSYVGK